MNKIKSLLVGVVLIFGVGCGTTLTVGLPVLVFPIPVVYSQPVVVYPSYEYEYYGGYYQHRHHH